MSSSIMNSYNTGLMKKHLIQEDDTYATKRSKLTQLKDEDKVSGWKLAARTTMNGKLDGGAGSVMADFIRLCAFFAGQQSFEMQRKLEVYKEQHEFYQKVLDKSSLAHEHKLAAANAGESVMIEDDDERESFNSFMNMNVLTLSEDEMASNGHNLRMGYQLGGGQDKNNDNYHNKEEWEGFCQLLDKKKDMESTTLNKLSTEMDLAVKESDSAQEMAANAIKKSNDVLSTQARTAGG